MFRSIIALLLVNGSIWATTLHQYEQKAAKKLKTQSSISQAQPELYLKNGLIFSTAKDSTEKNEIYQAWIEDGALPGTAYNNKDLDSLYLRNPSSLQVAYNNGVLSFRMQNFRKSEKFFRKAYSIQPVFWKNSLWLGRTAEKRGSLQQAEHWYKQAYKANPNDFTPLNSLALIYFRSRQNLKLTSLTKYLKNQIPNKQHTLYLLGMISYQRSEWAKAYEYFNDPLNQKNGSARFMAYESALRMNYLAEAENHLNYAIEYWTPDNTVMRSEAELEQLLEHLKNLRLKTNS